MTPDESPSAPAKKGLDASCTNLSEKTTAAPRAVAEPATVVSTKPSSAFVRPMVLCAARRGDGYFCSLVQLGFTATKCCGLRVLLRLQAQRCHRCDTHTVQTAESALYMAVYRRLLLHAGHALPTPSSPRVLRMGSRRVAEGCVDADSIRAWSVASARKTLAKQASRGASLFLAATVLLSVAEPSHHVLSLIRSGVTP